ncbi:MAG: hypothetical protein ACRELG_11605, partial [Gemmataceae bacterium]
MGFFDWLRKFLSGGKGEQIPQSPPSASQPASNPESPVLSGASDFPIRVWAPQPASSPAPSPPPVAPAPRPTTLNLDAGAFLPIARDELKEAAKEVRLGGAWFGRRDLI